MDNNYCNLIKSLRNYRAVIYGQFDQKSYFVVRETQDAANVIQNLVKENKQLKEGNKQLKEENKQLKEEIESYPGPAFAPAG